MSDWVITFGVLALVLVGGGAGMTFLVRTFTRKPEPEAAIPESDVQLLQETVEMLIERLKTAADEAVHEIELRQQELLILLGRVDERLSHAEHELRAAERPSYSNEAEVPRGEVYRMADEGVEEEEIAERSGLTRGEVELLLELQAMRK